jgi:acyl carrier protein
MTLDPKFDEKVIALIAQAVPRRLRKAAITPEMSLHKDLGIDSLGIAALLFRLEEAFGVALEDAAAQVDLGKLRTVRDAVDLSRHVVEQARPR